MIITIKVIPKSQVNQVMGWEGEALRIKVKGIPEDNEVNDNLIAFLSEWFSLPKSALMLVSGRASRVKRVAIAEEFEEKAKQKLLLVF